MYWFPICGIRGLVTLIPTSIITHQVRQTIMGADLTCSPYDQPLWDGISFS